jgi:hypothetical protein
MADTETVTVAVALNGTVSTAFDYRRYTSGRFYLPAEFNSDAITFQDAEKPDGTFAISKAANASSIAVGFTAHSAPAWYDIPVALQGAGAIKIVTAVAAAAAATIIVCLKSD